MLYIVNSFVLVASSSIMMDTNMFELILTDAVATTNLTVVKSLLMRSSHTVVSHVVTPYGNHMYIQVIIN